MATYIYIYVRIYTWTVQIVDTYEYLKIHIKALIERGGGAQKTIDI